MKTEYLQIMANHYANTNEVQICEGHLKVFLNSRERNDSQKEIDRILAKLEREISFGTLANPERIIDLGKQLKGEQELLHNGYIIID